MSKVLTKFSLKALALILLVVSVIKSTKWGLRVQRLESQVPRSDPDSLCAGEREFDLWLDPESAANAMMKLCGKKAKRPHTFVLCASRCFDVWKLPKMFVSTPLKTTFRRWTQLSTACRRTRGSSRQPERSCTAGRSAPLSRGVQQ